MEPHYAELYEKLSHFQCLLQRHQMHHHADCGPLADPTRGQGRVLALLKLQSEISTKDLSYLLGIRQQSVNELLHKLEKSGHVIRTQSACDRRIMMVQLTEKGRAEQQSGHDCSDVLSCLSSKEQEAFGAYLDRVIASLETRLGAGGEEESLLRWADAARRRMGEDSFNRLICMRDGILPHSSED